MKVYISVPITGYEIDHVEARCIFATGVLESKGHEAVNPLQVCGAAGDELDYAACMGRDIEALLHCDAILLMEGWKESKGCKLEHKAAELYGLQVFKGLDTVPENNALWYVLGKEDEP